MALFSDEPPPLHVPEGALQKPRAAELGADGLVACVICGNRLPPARMDIVGQGYRCAPCSHQAEIGRLQGGGDAAAHLSKRERAGLRESAGQMIALGLAMIVGGIVVLVAVGDLTSLGTVLIGGGVASISVGGARRGAAG